MKEEKSEDHEVPVASVVHNLHAALRQATAASQPSIQALLRVSQAMAPFVQAIQGYARYQKFVDSVDTTGWLPYHTLSINYVDEYGEDAAALDAALSRFYENHWQEIRQDIESRLDQYRIAEETRETFREALSAHDAGHYRCVCSVLFPVIDREFRIRFFEDGAGSISSRRMLEKLTGRGSLRDFMPREAYGWMLFGRLAHHLYEPIDNHNRSRYAKDFVPNRHAVSHGLLAYSTQKHSVNMLIMTDYIFPVLTATDLLSLEQ